MSQDRAEVFGGVDTHQDTHVAAAVDAAGRLPGSEWFPATAAGYTGLLAWLESHWHSPASASRAPAPTARALSAISPPQSSRSSRSSSSTSPTARRGGAGARPTPSTPTPPMSASRTGCGAFAPPISWIPAHGCVANVTETAAKQALRTLVRHHRALRAETAELNAGLLSLGEQANPALLAGCGVGADTAAALLVAASDNPHRMQSEASFAVLCETSPIEAPSGHTVRHASTVTATARPTTPCGEPPQPGCALTNAPSPTPSDGAANPRPHAKSSAASSATSHARSTGCSPTRPRSATAPTYDNNEPAAESPSPPPES